MDEHKLNTQKSLEPIFAAYSRSIKALFNISSIKIGDEYFDGSHFKFCNIEYRQHINGEKYGEWVNRHIFIDVIELTSSFMIEVVDLFSEHLDFEARKEKSDYKNKLTHLLNPDQILSILSLKEKFNDFCELYHNFRRVRNCLTHRFGQVSDHDEPPIYLKYAELKYFFEANGVIHEYDDLDIMIAERKKITFKKNEVIGIRGKPKKMKFDNDDIIKVSDKMLFGTSSFLFEKVKGILKQIAPSDIGLEKMFETYNPFELKIDVHGTLGANRAI